MLVLSRYLELRGQPQHCTHPNIVWQHVGHAYGGRTAAYGAVRWLSILMCRLTYVFKYLSSNGALDLFRKPQGDCSNDRCYFRIMPLLLPLELHNRSRIIRGVVGTCNTNATMLQWSAQPPLAAENHHFEGGRH